MKKKNKGFTLIELVAVLVMISILALVATVSVTRSMKRSIEVSYKNIEETMKTAAKNYVLDTGNTGVVTNKTLIEGKYMDTPIDPKTKKNCEINKSYVNVSGDAVSETNNFKYKYDVCLVCGSSDSRYMSKDCEGESKIVGIYRNYLEENNYIETQDECSSEKAIDVGTGLEVKYNIVSIKDNSTSDIFKELSNISSEIVGTYNDKDCNEYYEIDDRGNSVFITPKKNVGKIDSSCKVIVKDNNNSNNSNSVVKEKCYYIKHEVAEENTNKYNLIMYESDEKTEISKVNAIKLGWKQVRFKMFDQDNNNITNNTNFSYKLENNCRNGKNCSDDESSYIVSSRDYKNDNIDSNVCFVMYPYYPGNNSVQIKQLSDGCENVRLAVYSEGKRLRAFSVNVPEIVHAEKIYVSGNKVEIDGKSSKQVEVMMYPEDTDMKNKVQCKPIGNASKYATCSASGGILTFSGSLPTPLGDYAYFSVGVEDNSDDNKTNPITVRVKVNNVVPTSVSINYFGGTQCNAIGYRYFCSSSSNNYAYFTLVPSNAFYSYYKFSTPSSVFNNNFAYVRVYNSDFISIGKYNSSASSTVMNLDLTVYNTYNGANVSIKQSASPAVYTKTKKSVRECISYSTRKTIFGTTSTYCSAYGDKDYTCCP